MKKGDLVEHFILKSQYQTLEAKLQNNAREYPNMRAKSIIQA